MKRRSFLFSVPLALMVALPVSAQNVGGGLLNPSAEDAVGGQTISKLTNDEKLRFDSLKDSKKPIVDGGETTANREAIAKAAKWYGYRVSWVQYHGQNPPTMNDVVSEAVKVLGAKGQYREEFLREFSKELIAAIREVLPKNAKPIVRVNALRILVGVAAEARQEEVADTFLDILNNPNESDGVKLYALRGLKEVFAPGQALKDPKREARCIQDLLTFLARPAPPDSTADDVKDAFRYVRREAVRALANTRYPTAPGAKQPAGQTALKLLRLARKAGYSPEPSLGEQVEAAIGVCKLQAKLDKTYQPDYAAYQLGQFLVDFITQYNQYRLGNEFGIPWGLHTVRLMQALDDLEANSKDAPGSSFVKDLAAQARASLKPIEKTTRPEADPAKLDNWLQDMQQKSRVSPTLYNGVKDSVVKP